MNSYLVLVPSFSPSSYSVLKHEHSASLPDMVHLVGSYFGCSVIGLVVEGVVEMEVGIENLVAYSTRMEHIVEGQIEEADTEEDNQETDFDEKDQAADENNIGEKYQAADENNFDE